MKKWTYDLILGICVLAVSLGCIVYAVIVSDPRATYFLARADTYLGLIFGLLTLLSLLLILRAWNSRNAESGQQTVEPIWDKLTLVTVVSLFAYMLLLRSIGFIFDSLLLMWLLSFLYSVKAHRGKGEPVNRKFWLKTLGATGIFSLAATFSTYYIFVELLNTKLPKFSLF